MDELIEITQGDLQAALQKWEEAYRKGECISLEEAAAMSVDDLAKKSAEYLWGLLKQK